MQMLLDYKLEMTREYNENQRIRRDREAVDSTCNLLKFGGLLALAAVCPPAAIGLAVCVPLTLS